MGFTTSQDGGQRHWSLRVFRVDKGQEVYVRTLGTSYGGLFTHWGRGRSVYCCPEGCTGPIHKTDRFWKGYGAVELYDPTVDLWSPVVLEITETLELDFRGRWKRGQVWKVSRGEIVDKRKPPVRGELLEEVDALDWPEPFDIVPVLRALYHAERISLASKNPLPDRIMVTHSKGQAPPGVGPRARNQATDEAADTVSFREMIARTGQRWIPPDQRKQAE